MRGGGEAELEDCVKFDLVSDVLEKAFGNGVVGGRLSGKDKWSRRFEQAMRKAGKRWSGTAERTAKDVYVDVVAEYGVGALTPAAKSFMETLAKELETKAERLGIAGAAP